MVEALHKVMSLSEDAGDNMDLDQVKKALQEVSNAPMVLSTLDRAGVAGQKPAEDLKAALKRLTDWSENIMGNDKFFEAMDAIASAVQVQLGLDPKAGHAEAAKLFSSSIPDVPEVVNPAFLLRCFLALQRV